MEEPDSVRDFDLECLVRWAGKLTQLFQDSVNQSRIFATLFRWNSWARGYDNPVVSVELLGGKVISLFIQNYRLVRYGLHTRTTHPTL